MLKKLLLAVLALSMTVTAMQAAAGVRFNVIKGDAEKPYNTMVNKKLEAIGFVLSDPHERINDGYAEKYGGTDLTNLGFFSVAADKAMREIFLKEPKIGGFVPFNLHIYKKKAEGETYVGHVLPATMLDIVGIKDPASRKAFEETFKPLDKLVQDSLGGEVKFVGTNKIAKNPMMEFELDIKSIVFAETGVKVAQKVFDEAKSKGDKTKIKEAKSNLEEAKELLAEAKAEPFAELGDFIEAFQGVFEASFEYKKYIIAGYKNFQETYVDDLELPFAKYDAYWVYSLCHFGFSEGIFNKGRPDAGVFAPCSMYMYVEKGSSVLKIGMPTLQNWIEVMGIKDAKKVKEIQGIDKEIIKIMNGLGAKSI